MTDLEFVPVRTDAQLATVAALAREIWYEYYVALIGRDQVDYMVERFQTPEAIRRQIEEGCSYYLTCQGERPVGYFAVQAKPDEHSLFLSKFYLRKETRGSGTGRRCLEFIEQLGRSGGLATLWLTVNKGNPSVSAYRKLGFAVTADLVMDIGGGYVMDDYRMEKPL